MKNSIIALLVALLVLTPFFGQQNELKKQKGVLASLKANQRVNVKDSGDRYSIMVIDGNLKLPQSHTILEVETDFVVVEDVTGLNVVRIPLTSIKAVVHFKGFEK